MDVGVHSCLKSYIHFISSQNKGTTGVYVLSVLAKQDTPPCNKLDTCRFNSKLVNNRSLCSLPSGKQDTQPCNKVDTPHFNSKQVNNSCSCSLVSHKLDTYRFNSKQVSNKCRCSTPSIKQDTLI